MKPAIIMMSRVPQAGKTKTRLMPMLTGEECAIFQLACLMDICGTVAATDACGYIFYTGSRRELLQNSGLLGNFPAAAVESYRNSLSKMSMLPQRGEELGQRMASACRQILAKHDRVVVIGTDIPGLSGKILSEAFRQLESADLVIGPAADGGYYLLGMKQTCPDVFTDIHWGSGSVFNETMAAIGRSGLSCARLPVQKDIDTWEDLLDFYRSGSGNAVMEQLFSYRWAAAAVYRIGE